MRFITFILLITILSCSVSQPLNKSGSYSIEYVLNDVDVSATGQVVKLKGIKGLYFFKTDTLKSGDSVYISFIKNIHQATLNFKAP